MPGTLLIVEFSTTALCMSVYQQCTYIPIPGIWIICTRIWSSAQSRELWLLLLCCWYRFCCTRYTKMYTPWIIITNYTGTSHSYLCINIMWNTSKKAYLLRCYTRRSIYHTPDRATRLLSTTTTYYVYAFWHPGGQHLARTSSHFAPQGSYAEVTATFIYVPAILIYFVYWYNYDYWLVAKQQY